MFAANDFNPSHHVLEHFPVDLLSQADVFVALPVDVQQVDEQLDGSALQEDSEHDHRQGGGEEHLGCWHVGRVHHRHQGETHRAPQPAVCHDELLFKADWVNVLPQKVNYQCQGVNGEESDCDYKEKGPADKPVFQTCSSKNAIPR